MTGSHMHKCIFRFFSSFLWKLHSSCILKIVAHSAVPIQSQWQALEKQQIKAHHGKQERCEMKILKWGGGGNLDDTDAKKHKFTKGVLQCRQTLACSLGTLVCQVVGFTSKPEGFDMKRLYRLERALWNAPGRLALLWQWRGGNAGWMGGK